MSERLEHHQSSRIDSMTVGAPYRAGVLRGVRVLEMGGIGPNPWAGMVLADMGADVIRLDRAIGRSIREPNPGDPVLRGRQTIGVDLRSAHGLALARQLAGRADVLSEGFRPGVMERLGLGPDVLLEQNPRLVYGRVTGYGQHGPMATAAGHDINYVAVTGVLGASQRVGENPMTAINYLGDYGGGAMLLLFGIVCALLEARSSGHGQVVDAAMVDGVALMSTNIHGMHSAGTWSEQPGTNLLDTGAHFYDTYRTGDDRFVAVGALEPQFYSRLLDLLGIPEAEMPQWDRRRWPEFKRRLAALFATRSSADWRDLLEGEETCATVVNLPFESPHPHLVARGTFIELDGVRQPAPAPRFDRTPGRAAPAEQDPVAALARWDVDAAEFGVG